MPLSLGNLSRKRKALYVDHGVANLQLGTIENEVWIYTWAHSQMDITNHTSCYLLLVSIYVYPFFDYFFFIKVHAGQNVVQADINPSSESLIVPLIHLDDENETESGGSDSGIDDDENDLADT